MYKVIKFFHDLQDKNHPYNVGDEYPRAGLKPTKKRIEELAGKDNKQGQPLIEEVAAEKKKAEEKKEAAENKEAAEGGEGAEK